MPSGRRHKELGDGGKERGCERERASLQTDTVVCWMRFWAV